MRYGIAILALLTLAAAPAPHPELLVSTDWLQSHLRDHNLVLVEVGDRAAYEKEHIPGARFLPLSEVAVTRNDLPNELPEVATLEATMRSAGIPSRGRIIVYAKDLLAAARAFFTLDYLGCESNLALLDGGFAKWTAENRAVESGPPAPRTSSFSACPRPEKIVRLAAMRKLVDAVRSGDAPLAIIDSRPPEAYFGTETGHGIERPGHIPGATNIPWTENLTTGGAPVFRTAEDLRSAYDDAGVRADTAVVYCRTGMQASVTYFVLRYLGRDVHLYDASYIEWNCAAGTSIERAPTQ